MLPCSNGTKVLRIRIRRYLNSTSYVLHMSWRTDYQTRTPLASHRYRSYVKFAITYGTSTYDIAQTCVYVVSQMRVRSGQGKTDLVLESMTMIRFRIRLDWTTLASLFEQKLNQNSSFDQSRLLNYFSNVGMSLFNRPKLSCTYTHILSLVTRVAWYFNQVNVLQLFIVFLYKFKIIIPKNMKHYCCS